MLIKMSHPYTSESIWYDKYRVDEAERRFHERPTSQRKSESSDAKEIPTSSLVDEIARARQQIKHSLQSGNNVPVPNVGDGQISLRVIQLEKENQQLRNSVQDLHTIVSKLEGRISSLELGSKGGHTQPSANHVVPTSKPAPAKKEENNVEDDDDVDLFGSDDDTEANELRDKRLQEYAAKKSNKPKTIAKSSVVLDVKPWDDETDMAAIEVEVRNIEMDGLLWGASKLSPLAYGIMKLQICCVVEDKVSIEELQEKIEAIEELVQSVDIAAFNKI